MKPRLTLVLQRPTADDPAWPAFTTSATDFRPHWNGDLVNVFTTIRPQDDAKETQEFAVESARQLAAWIMAERNRFGPEDRFQIVIGWPEDVRATGRQIVKIGGDFSHLDAIASGATEIPMHGSWSKNVF